MNAVHVQGGIGEETRRIAKLTLQVWKLVPRKHKQALACAAAIIALTSLSNTAIALLLGGLVDGVAGAQHAPNEMHAYFWQAGWFLGLIAGTYVVRELLNVLHRNLVQNTCSSINSAMSVRLVAHMMRVDLGRLSQDKIGALHGRMFRGVTGFIQFLRLAFLDCFPALSIGLFALLTAAIKEPILGLVMIGVIPVAVWLTVRQLMSQKGVRLELMRDCEEIDGAVIEQFAGLEYVRAANTHMDEVQRLTAAMENRRRREVRHHFEMSLYGCAKALNEGLFHVIVLGLAIYLALEGRITPGAVLTFSVLFLNVMAPLAEVHRVLDEGHEASLRVHDLLEMLAEPADRSFVSVRTSEPALRPAEPLIEINDLMVDYHTPAGKVVRALDGLSLTVRHGETIGVAGRSGCGKSTWIKVLLRLTHPCAGTVRLGGVPLEEISRETIGRLIGYIGQSPFVVAKTIAENIAYGTSVSDRAAIMQAAQLAAIHDEILDLPGGYDAPVTEKGQNLSGGQRQRLAIARILLKQPPILILDEATSALDNLSERLVQRSLGVRDPNRTTIVVAHRLSTLRDADRILFFDEGRILEIGTYDELVNRNGAFADLVRSAETGVCGF